MSTGLVDKHKTSHCNSFFFNAIKLSLSNITISKLYENFENVLFTTATKTSTHMKTSFN